MYKIWMEVYRFLKEVVNDPTNKKILDRIALTVFASFSMLMIYHWFAGESVAQPVTTYCSPTYTDKTNNTWDYVTVYADEKLLSSKEQSCEVVLNNTVQRLLVQADVYLKEKKVQPYGQTIARYFADNGEEARKVIEHLRKERIVMINEEIDSISRHTTVTVKLAINVGADIKNIMHRATEGVCIRKAMTHWLNRLKNEGEVVITLPQIIDELCSQCEEAYDIKKKYVNECGGDLSDCSHLYFEQGQYELTELSRGMLRGLASVLADTHRDHLLIQFEGLTDPSDIHGKIDIFNGCRAGERGQQMGLNGDNSLGHPIGEIRNNLDLAYARGYSCYLFMKQQKTSSINLSYTGWGVSPFQGDDRHMRTVRIVVKNDNQ